MIKKNIHLEEEGKTEEGEIEKRNKKKRRRNSVLCGKEVDTVSDSRKELVTVIQQVEKEGNTFGDIRNLEHAHSVCVKNLENLEKLRQKMIGGGLREVRDVTSRWDTLRRTVVTLQSQSVQYGDLTRQCTHLTARLAAPELQDMPSIKKELFSLNLSLHNLLTCVNTEDRISLVCHLKQEVIHLYLTWECHHSLLLAVENQRRHPPPSPWRWWTWGVSTSLILLSLVSLGSLVVSCLQPHCCSDPAITWTLFSNPVTFTYTNGPPPI